MKFFKYKLLYIIKNISSYVIVKVALISLFFLFYAYYDFFNLTRYKYFKMTDFFN